MNLIGNRSSHTGFRGVGLSRRVLMWSLSLCCAAFAGSESLAAGKMVRISLDGQQKIGTVVAHNPEIGWFLERDGRLQSIDLNAVADFSVLGTFRPYNSMELKDQLAREFGTRFRVATTGRYVVVASGDKAERYASLFDALYRQFVVMFSARGFKMTEAEFPLVAVVYPDEAGFRRFCEQENVQPQPGLRGFYLPGSNRVALYDSAAAAQTTLAGLDRTILHEAVHQVAFNTGIHSRIGENPLWLVEGLATALEVNAVRTGDRLANPLNRVNDNRYRWFLQSLARRPSIQLADLIANDDRFRSAVLDAYADSWALTFYLMETRSADFTAYLRLLAKRDPLVPLTPEQRLADFQQVFGKDLSLLEARIRRYYDDLSTGNVAR